MCGGLVCLLLPQRLKLTELVVTRRQLIANRFEAFHLFSQRCDLGILCLVQCSELLLQASLCFFQLTGARTALFFHRSNLQLELLQLLVTFADLGLVLVTGDTGLRLTALQIRFDSLQLLRFLRLLLLTFFHRLFGLSNRLIEIGNTFIPIGNFSFQFIEHSDFAVELGNTFVPLCQQLSVLAGDLLDLAFELDTRVRFEFYNARFLIIEFLLRILETLLPRLQLLDSRHELTGFRL